VKVEKDFIWVAFETLNNIFTLPIVKMPQSFSQYAREPTQIGDKGYAVPGDYYQGGVSGDSGGNTDFYPRANLSTLSFQPLSHTQNRQRDYDQLNHMGGPNGWIVNSFTPQPKSQQNQQSQNSGGSGPGVGAASAMKTRARQMNVERFVNGGQIIPYANGSSSGSNGSSQSSQQQQQQPPQDATQFSFDKNGKALMQSKDTNHVVTADQQSGTLSMIASKRIYHKAGKVYLGGDPDKDQFALVCVSSGSGCAPCANVYAKVS
jgi:hypothetical protein